MYSSDSDGSLKDFICDDESENDETARKLKERYKNAKYKSSSSSSISEAGFDTLEEEEEYA